MLLASRPRFERIAYAILRNREDAEDAVQDAALSACLHSRSFEGRSALTTWFTRIVLNAALMIRRKRKSSRIDPFPESRSKDEIPWTEGIPALQPNPEIVYAKEETFQWIDILLGQMSPALRQAFTLRYYYEMYIKDASALLGITTGTFKSRLFRARKLLLSYAQRAPVAPIHRSADSPFAFGQNGFPPLAAIPSKVSSPEMAFS